MKKYFYKYSLVLLLQFSSWLMIQAQVSGIAINDNNSTADASAMLDVNVNSAAAKKGILIRPSMRPLAGPVAGQDRNDDQILGRVTPCCPWYFPPRSL